MIHKTISIKMAGSNPDARLITYIQEESPEILIKKRPLILICPGGGYRFTSDREAEPIALAFLSMGYNAAILRYSVDTAEFPTALLELGFSIKYIRDNADALMVDANKIVVCGFSAGGHLAASLCCFWKEQWLNDELGTKADAIKPNGAILGYPVITSGEYAHQSSFDYLLKDKRPKLNDKMSLENQVTNCVPPTFIWSTFTDQAVPVENSLMYVSALKKAGVPTEFHMYPNGLHGLALADERTETPDHYGIQIENSSWISLANTWLKNL